MDLDTQKKLVQMNYDFYEKIGTHFDSSRNYFWAGWEKLVPIINTRIEKNSIKELRVLDIGCGNARFLDFLVTKLPKIRIKYTGIDSSKTLIHAAKRRVSDLKDSRNLINYELINSDIIFEKWEDRFNQEEFDLILLFGVMHHVPGEQNRYELIEKITTLLSTKGIFVFTIWKFMEVERLQKRIVDVDSNEGTKVLDNYGISKFELEKDDYILDWRRGEVAYRFCHFMTDDEKKQIFNKLNLRIVDNFMSDAKEGNVNEYSTIEKPQ